VPGNPSDAAAEIAAAGARWLAAFHREDVEALLQLYDDGAVLLPDGAPAVEGLAAVRAWHAAFFAAWRARQSIENSEIVVAGGWAFMRGRYELELVPRGGGGPTSLRGKHLVVWTRDGAGGWRVARDIWNADHPPAARRG
jgi:ketosteroid isomerase-like protein